MCKLWLPSVVASDVVEVAVDEEAVEEEEKGISDGRGIRGGIGRGTGTGKGRSIEEEEVISSASTNIVLNVVAVENKTRNIIIRIKVTTIQKIPLKQRSFK